MIPEWLAERIRGLAEQLKRLAESYPPTWNSLAVLRHQNTVDRTETEYWRAKWHEMDIQPK